MVKITNCYSRWLNFALSVVPSFFDNLSMPEIIANDDKDNIKNIMNLIEKRGHLEKSKDKLVFQKKENKIFNSEFYVK